jgi:hypothetical protein
MRIHQALQKKSSDQKQSAPTSNSLAFRPFAVQPKPEESERSHSTKGYESAMPDFAILNPEGERSMPVQPKLAIGQVGDKYEQEADQVAKQVVQLKQGRVKPTLQLRQNSFPFQAPSPLRNPSVTSGLTIQRVMLGPNGQLDTQNDNQIDQVVAYLKSQNYNTLLSIRTRLDPNNDKDASYIKLINYELGKADVLSAVFESSNEYGGIFTSAAVFVNGQHIGTTEPINGNDSNTTYYVNVLDKDKASEEEVKEEHNSRNDSEVSTLEEAYNLLQEYLQDYEDSFTGNTQIRIVVAGTSGPCDGCKNRLEQFKHDVLNMLPNGALLSIESAYLNYTSTKKRNETTTRYGYTNQTSELTANRDQYYNYRYPLVQKKNDELQLKSMVERQSNLGEVAFTKDVSLEQEADVMGGKAARLLSDDSVKEHHLVLQAQQQAATNQTVQRISTSTLKVSPNRQRELESDEVEADLAGIVVQRAVDNNDSAIGQRIVIINRRARDYNHTGQIQRFSRYSDNFAVEFDNERGRLYRVHYTDMDYETLHQESSSSNREATTTVESTAWETIGNGSQYQNCAHFALQNEDLAIEQDVNVIASRASEVELEVTRSTSEATVVFYGSGNYYSHAIRKVDGSWQEVQYMGGPLRRYTGSEDPPRMNNNDNIVLMLKPRT